MSAIFQVYGLTAADGASSWGALSPLTAAALSVEPAAHGRMHIMGAGKWEGHPSGPLVIDRPYLEKLVAQFDAQKNPMPVDYDHSAPKRGDTRAAGWINELAIEDDESGVPQLWATDVEWTPAAAEAIRSKEYLFTSPAWSGNAKDRVSGEMIGPRLINVALTNLPFFDGQHALTCSAVDASAPVVATEPPAPTDDVVAAAPPEPINEVKPMDEFLQAVSKAAGLTPEAVMERLVAKADEIGAMLRDAPAVKEGEEAPPPDPVVAADAPVVEPPVTASITPTDAARIASEGKLNGLIASVASISEAVGKLTAERAAEKTAAETKIASERAERIASMVRDGRLKTAEETDAAKLLAYDEALFASTYGDRKPTVPVGIVQAGPEVKPAPGSDVTFTASEQVTVQSLLGSGRYSLAKARERVIALRQS